MCAVKKDLLGKTCQIFPIISEVGGLKNVGEVLGIAMRGGKKVK